MNSSQGTITCELLNIRSGPGTQHAVLRQLRRGTRVTVTGQEGNWLRLKLDGKTGYAHKNFIFVPETAPPRGFLRERAALLALPLPAPAAKRVTPQKNASPEARLAAQTWNECGGLLGPLSREVDIEPAAGVAVLCVESSGQGFGPEGRLKIRFENHIFRHRWGSRTESNAKGFDRHFRFDAAKKWQGHEFRTSAGKPWQNVHRSQAAEWEALELARTFDDTDALCSISMGAPQLMGFNFASAGFQSVQEMFAAFGHPVTGARDQILGLFDFIKGPGDSSAMIAALQRQDFVAFAGRYNGPGQALVYAEKIERYFREFEELA